MQELISKFDLVHIDERSEGSELALRLRRLFPRDKIKSVGERPFAETSGELSAMEFDRSKRQLYVTEFKGRFFKRCPGSKPGLACCNYFVLNWGQQCDMNCSYCYLQSYINSPVLTIYSNLDRALKELAELKMRDTALRVGTGETVDSLSLDPLTGFSRELIAFFKNYPKWNLEFKTKSSLVDQFLDVEHGGNVIVSWSINPQAVIEAEEHGTASLKARFEAAEKCLSRGFQISFHIDPMIYHPGWEENYHALVDEIAARFRPYQLPYLSVGALRFQPEQRAMMRERFGMKSYVTSAEMFPSRDGKMRYDSGLRQKMFQHVLSRFKEHSADWKVFICMETPETWSNTVASSPFKSPALADLFTTAPVHAVRRAEEARAKAPARASLPASPEHLRESNV